MAGGGGGGVQDYQLWCGLLAAFFPFGRWGGGDGKGREVSRLPVVVRLLCSLFSLSGRLGGGAWLGRGGVKTASCGEASFAPLGEGVGGEGLEGEGRGGRVQFYQLW